MAVVSKAKKESKHSHLQELYSKKKDKITLDESNETIVLKEEIVKIPKQQLVIDICIIVGIGIIGSAGFFVTLIE
ncbi:MAG: hypothetical protein ACOCXT_01115 [Candidatus Dojkabacteria bacterium]